MKKTIFFVLFAVMFTTLSFAQSQLPTLSGYENLSDKGVALSDTAQEGKSFKFFMNTSVSTGNRYTKWDVALAQNVSIPKGAKISANVMVPVSSGDVQASVTLLNNDVVVMNSGLYVISKNSSSGVVFHRQNFQFPEIDGSFNKIRVNLSYLQNEIGSRTIFFDGIYLINGTSETLIDDCNGGGLVMTKPGVTTLTTPTNGATNVSITPTFAYNPTINTTQYQLQIMTKIGTVVYDQKNAATSVTLTTPLAHNTAYDWRVRCWNGNTPSDNWSSTSSFTTVSQVVSVPVFTVGNRDDSQNSITLNWIGGEVQFQLMNVSGTVLQSPSSTTSPYTFSNLADGDYQLRGQFKNPLSDWSVTILFKVKTQVTVNVPVIGTPANNSTGNPVATTLSFTGNASNYEVLIAKNSEFTNDVRTHTITSSPFLIPNLAPSTTYYLKMRGKNGNVYSEFTSVINFMTIGVTGVDENNSLPTKFDLLQNYPNPFNPSTKISFSLPHSSPVTISFFDVTGREVAQQINQTFSGGVHTINFDGAKLSSGIYIYTISSNVGTLSKKMLLMK